MTSKYAVSKYLITAAVMLLACISGFAQNQSVLKPNSVTLQYAGDLGMFSVGPSWSYGKNNRWSTDLLLGFVPKSNTADAAMTISLREKISPWEIALPENILNGNLHNEKIRVSPAVFSVYGNVITGSNYWLHEPSKYHHANRYKFSSRFRFGVGFGSQIHYDRLTFYYEFSSYDLAIRTAICNKSVNVFDILTLGLGFQVRF